MQSDPMTQTQDAGPATSITGTEEAAKSASPAGTESIQEQHPYHSFIMPQASAPAAGSYHQHSHGHQGAFDLATMNSTLLGLDHRPQHPSQYVHGQSQAYNSATSPSMAPPMVPHMVPYGDPAFQTPNHNYYFSQRQMPQYYHVSPINGRQHTVFYSSPLVISHAQPNYYYSQSSHYSGHPPAAPANMLTGSFTPASSRPGPHSLPYFATGTAATTGGHHGRDGAAGKRSVVCGPPRKPRQSGHALWVGNLPPQTDLMALVRHVCKETSGLESLFLISKSNCAFANFKDEQACSVAQKILHDSKFQSARLVSRLRKGTMEGLKYNTAAGPGSTPSTSHENSDAESAMDDVENKVAAVNGDAVAKAASPQPARRNSQNHSHVDRFFILKSLTTEDLDLSVQSGIWATQSHNEENLNQAFQAADNVYLIFSANKSGEYFGYARMTSKINEDPSAAILFAPTMVSTAEVDLPKVIPTDATEYVPKGRIVDDSARGSIFWEADQGDSAADSEVEVESTGGKVDGSDEETKIWGKPFNLEWLSSNRLPFHRTRGLRNPWNSNREVKIARDGTEVEPSVGRSLIGLFNRVQSPVVAVPSPGAPMNFVPVYQSMQPYG